MNKILIAALFVPLFASPIMAQDETPSDEPGVQFNLLSADDLLIGSTVTIDAAFGEEHEIGIPAPFTFLIPTSDDIQELLEPAPKPGEAFVKVNFATLERELIENLQFIPFTLPMGAAGERLNALGDLLANDAFDMAVQDYEEHTRDLVRPIDVNGYTGVEVIGRYQSPDLGLMYVRIVGILNPDNEHGVVALSNVVSAREEIPTPNDFPRTRSGTALKNFQFITE